MFPLGPPSEHDSRDAAAIRDAWARRDWPMVQRHLLGTTTGRTALVFAASIILLGVAFAEKMNGKFSAPPHRDCQNCPATPANSPARWITSDDYPAAAQRDALEGTSGFTLSIAAQGEVTDCIVVQSSGHAALDDATCTLLRARARMYPATDAGGIAIVGRWSSRIRWQLASEEKQVRP